MLTRQRGREKVEVIGEGETVWWSLPLADVLSPPPPLPFFVPPFLFPPFFSVLFLPLLLLRVFILFLSSLSSPSLLLLVFILFSLSSVSSFPSPPPPSRLHSLQSLCSSLHFLPSFCTLKYMNYEYKKQTHSHAPCINTAAVWNSTPQLLKFLGTSQMSLRQ